MYAFRVLKYFEKSDKYRIKTKKAQYAHKRRT